MKDDDYLTFIHKIKRKIGIDLNLYKEQQMKRRITSLRNKREFSTFDHYFQAMNTNTELLNEFLDRLTINVSEFYRNPKRWNVLNDKIVPLLLKNRDKLSIWSAACSTGEEPYSLAILFREYFPTASVHITATDIDDNALVAAKQGLYSEKALKELPFELKKKYFSKQGEGYIIDPSLKKNVTFKKHNILADRYPRDIDLIVCRNVLIYFTDEAKKHVYQNFSDALKRDGVLFVGSTEQIFNPSKYDLRILDTFFYQRK